MNTKHTPGPWYATDHHVQSSSINENNYVCMAEGDSEEQSLANARLISSAPDLLEALEATGYWLLPCQGCNEHNPCAPCLARLAIKKAGGE